MREQASKPLEPGQQTREPALQAADDEVPDEVLRAIQDWKAGMIDPWADGFFGEEETASANRRSHRRKAS